MWGVDGMDNKAELVNGFGLNSSASNIRFLNTRPLTATAVVGSSNRQAQIVASTGSKKDTE